MTRWVSDDPQPGIVEFKFVDAGGKDWTFIEKQAIVWSGQLDGKSQYPQSSSVRCCVRSLSSDEVGRQVAEIDTQTPWGVESIEGSHIFSVFVGQLSYSGAEQ
jgi:hypothetical protein